MCIVYGIYRSVAPDLIHSNRNLILTKFASLAGNCNQNDNFQCSRCWQFHQNDYISDSMFDLFVLGFSPSLQLTCEVMRSYPTLGRAKHQKAVATAKNRIFGLDMHLCDSIRHQFIQDYQYLLDEWRKLIHITYLNSTKLGKRWKCEKNHRQSLLERNYG